VPIDVATPNNVKRELIRSASHLISNICNGSKVRARECPLYEFVKSYDRSGRARVISPWILVMIGSKSDYQQKDRQLAGILHTMF